MTWEVDLYKTNMILSKEKNNMLPLKINQDCHFILYINRQVFSLSQKFKEDAFG